MGEATEPYEGYLHELLKDPREVLAYLRAAADEGGDTYALAVRDLFLALNPDARSVLKAAEEWGAMQRGTPCECGEPRCAANTALRKSVADLRRARDGEGGEG